MRSNSKTLKRSISPFEKKVNHKISEDLISDKKKKIINSPYEKVIKEFQSYGKEKKKGSGYIKGSIDKDNSKNNKFRIVTEPVDSGILHLGKSNIFNNSITRNPNSKKRLDTQGRQSNQQIVLNLRQKSQSRQRVRTNPIQKCLNCTKYCEELDYLKRMMSKVISAQNKWRNGQSSLTDIKDFFNLSTQIGKSPKKNQYKVADSVLSEVKKQFYDLMRDVESLSFIDYPKMLSLDIFTYQHSYSQYTDPNENEVKDLLNQLRLNIEGKVTQYDTEDTFSDNTYTKQIIRNLKNRLGHCLRENLQLRMKKMILERAQEISQESEDYLRKVIEEVLMNYTIKGM